MRESEEGLCKIFFNKMVGKKTETGKECWGVQKSLYVAGRGEEHEKRSGGNSYLPLKE